MTRRCAFGLGNLVAILLGNIASANSAGNLFGGFLHVHKRCVDQYRRNARPNDLGHQMGNVHLHRVVQMAATGAVGDHRHLITLAVFQEMGALAASALGALLIAGTLTHKQAVLGNHEFGLPHDGKTQRHRGHIAQLLDLHQRKFRREPHTLRAKIDLASPNMNLRDPAIYRIKYAEHHRQGNKWCIYPMYDFAHPIQDAIEGITHSMCSLEFENHRPLYNWVIENIFGTAFPKQREFARLNMTNTVMSKRYLRELVEMGIVDGWDDPRMPTLCGLRRRGYTPTSIFTFVREAGISKSDNLIDMRQLEACIRSELDLTAQRRIAVLDPVKLIVDNYPEDKTEYFDVANNPNREANDTTTRKVAFTRELWIENEDFAEVPPPKFKRLTIGGEVRLMGAYIVKCTGVEKNADGSIAAIHCTADLETGNGNPADGRKVKGTIHWVSAAHAVDAEVRLYENLVLDGEGDFTQRINPNSLSVRHAKVEKSLAGARPGDSFQFIRIGYFCADPDGTAAKPVFNRSVGLKDSWAKQVKKQ